MMKNFLSSESFSYIVPEVRLDEIPSSYASTSEVLTWKK